MLQDVDLIAFNAAALARKQAAFTTLGVYLAQACEHAAMLFRTSVVFCFVVVLSGLGGSGHTSLGEVAYKQNAL